MNTANNQLLPPGSVFYSVSSLLDYRGECVSYKVNQWVHEYGPLPAPRMVQTSQGVVKVEYFATEQALHEKLYPSDRKPKKHRLAKAMIMGIAALAGFLDDVDL